MFYLPKISHVVTASALLTSMSLVSMSAYAGTSIHVGASSLGLQLGIAQSLTDNVNIKLAYSGASYDADGETDGVDYEYDLDLSSVSLLLDWHAFDNGFRFTAGALANNNEITAESKISGATVEVGDSVFTSDQVGRLEGDISFDSLAPYLGIGWGRAVADGLSVSLDLGVVFQGEPEVNLQSVGGSFSDNPLLIAEVEREEQELQDDADEFDLYPVISLGLSYRF